MKRDELRYCDPGGFCFRGEETDELVEVIFQSRCRGRILHTGTRKSESPPQDAHTCCPPEEFKGMDHEAGTFIEKGSVGGKGNKTLVPCGKKRPMTSLRQGVRKDLIVCFKR